MDVDENPPGTARSRSNGVPAPVEKDSVSEIEQAAAQAEQTRGVSLTDRAYGDIEEMIVTLRLHPGEVLSETTLSRRLGIGRTPVREALQRLAREGLVTVLPRRGILVSDFNVKSQLRLLEVRREIERLLARSAATRSNDEQRRRFAALAIGMQEAAQQGDDFAFMRLDREFNALIAICARNEFAAKVIALMAGLSRRFWFMHNQQGDDLPVAAQRHAAVADAIAAGDPEAAARASDLLLDYIDSITRAAVDW